MNISQFEQYLKGLETSPSTLTQYCCRVQRYLGHIGKKATPSSDSVLKFLDSLGGSHENKRGSYKALKVYFKASGIEWSVPWPERPKGYNPARPVLDGDMARAMLAIAKREAMQAPISVNLRNHAILCLLMDTGMRRSEISKLDRVGYDPPELTIHMAKWQGDRVAVLAPETMTTINIYLETRQDSNPALFLGWKDRINPLTVGVIFRRYADKVGAPKGFSCHAARRGLATGLYEAGMTDREIMELIGWRSISTLQSYIRLKPARVSAKARELHPVFGA